MEILLDDIPDEGLQIDANEESVWLCGVIKESFGERFEKTDHAKFRATIFKVNDNVTIDGDFKSSLHNSCDRCLGPYEDALSFKVHTVLAPLHDHKRDKEFDDKEEAEIVKEDLEFSFYEGDRFDLAEILGEQIVLAEPMKHLCREDCKGLCQRCGKDLNQGACGCKEDKTDPRWAALKQITVGK